MNEIKFYKTNEPYGFLNNFKKARMYVYDYWWDNVETPYQAQKCVHNRDFRKFLECKTPKEARDLGQTVQMITHWDLVKVDIMYECVLAKFSQNHGLLKQLLETGDATLIESSPVDKFWGQVNGVGENNLGKILMRVREKLKGF